MFIEQKKKKNYRTFIYSAIIIVLCLLIIVIAWPAETAAQEENPPADSTLQSQLQKDFPVNSTAEEPEEDNSVISQAASAYYLVKRADGQIKVFFIDELGNQIELENTEIIYEVLSIEDQKLFDEGIVVNNQEELAVLLQDFES